MFKQIVLLVVLGVTLGSTADIHTEAIDRRDRAVTFFTCTPSSPELNDHPSDCTKYIQCDHGRAVERSCAYCGTSWECAGSPYLHFQRRINDTACIWPRYSPCSHDTESTTTEDPDSPPPDESGTTPDPTFCIPDCDAEENDCRSYKYCNRTTNNPDKKVGVWVIQECESGNFFNPDESDRVGTCTEWEELDKNLQDRYNKQDRCSFCTITPNPSDSDCTRSYIYTDKGISTVKHCKAPRLFEKARQGCVHNCVRS